MIVCPGCGAVEPTEQDLGQRVFEWACGACHRSFEVRVVFLPRPREIDGVAFRAQVSRLLEEQGLSKTDLAKLVGVTPAYISTILSGRRAVSAEVAQRVLCALGVTAGRLHMQRSPHSY